MPANDCTPRDNKECEPYSATQANHTPQRRDSLRDESISIARRPAAGPAALRNGICLISGDHAPVRTCHLLARDSEGELLTKLEWAWGLAYHSLHVDTRFNLIHLNYNLRSLFDNDYWFLIPEANIVGELLRYIVKSEKWTAEDPPRQHRDIRKVLGDGPFKYHLIPTPKMADILIHRRVFQHPQDPPKPPSAENHIYPFDTLPCVLSHTLPHFVIYNAGAKMYKLLSSDIRPDLLLKKIPNLSGTLYSIQILCEAWKGMKVPASFISDIPAHSGRLLQPPRPGDGSRSSQGPPVEAVRNAPCVTRNPMSPAGGSESHGGIVDTLEQQHGSRSTDTATTNLTFSDGESASANNMVIEEEDFGDEEVEDEEDDATFENRMHSWKESSATIAKTEGWEKDLHNDSQLGEYVKEPPRRVSELLTKSSATLSRAAAPCQDIWMHE